VFSQIQQGKSDFNPCYLDSCVTSGPITPQSCFVFENNLFPKIAFHRVFTHIVNLYATGNSFAYKQSQ